MIPMFKAKEEEAQHKYEKIIEVKNQLNQFKDEMGISTQKRQLAQPLATTSFIPGRVKSVSKPG